MKAVPATLIRLRVGVRLLPLPLPHMGRSFHTLEGSHMATQFIDATLYVLVDSDGDYVADHDREGVATAYEDSIGELNCADGFRIVEVTIRIPLPVLKKVTATVPEDAAPTQVVPMSAIQRAGAEASFQTGGES